jgi:hypothetical protein
VTTSAVPADAVAADAVSADTPASGRRYGRAFALGALLAGFACYWMVTSGTFDPGHRVPYSGNFYDVQAHRILEGHLSMPESVLGIEGYEHDGNWYMYFGPAPALLRLPVAAVTDSLDGQTGVVSMALAFVVLMVALGRLSWRVRRWARPGAEVDGLDEVLAGVIALALGIGTTVVFLGVGPYVYHEASLWGLALAFAAFEAILSWIERPRVPMIVVAGVLTLLALLSRLAIGLGPAAALGLLAVAVGIARLWPRSRGVVARVGLAVDGLGWSPAAGLAAAALLPIALYAAVNAAKFGTLFSLPFEHQAVNAVVPERRAILDANGGTLFSVKALPTNLWQYLRPDALRLEGAWPWVRLPTWRPTVFGDLRYDMLDHTSSVTAAMPALFVLAIGGIVAMVRASAREARDRLATLASLDLPVLGAACSIVPSLVFLYITERYTADFLPLLVLSALAGLHAFVAWARSPSSRRGWVAAVSIVLGVLVVWGCVANLSIARDYQIGREQLTTFRNSGG